MRHVRLITWNVLHRIHGEKWSKHVVAPFPDERVRITRIAARVEAWFAKGVDAVCLQEVSGDQLAALRTARATPHAHKYPRVPGWYRFWAKPLLDRTEHLVTLTAGPGTAGESTTFESDDGKGLLAIDLDGLRLVNTHLTFGRRGPAQLKQAAEVLRRGQRGALVGDLNAEREAVSATLGPDFAIAEAGRATCAPSRRHEPGKAIDHVISLGGELEEVDVLDGEGLSDHHPVAATLRF